MMTSLFRIMQSKFVLVAFAITAVVATSCKKALDPEPKDVVLDNQFLKNFWDADFMIRGAYQALQPIVEYKFIQGELRGDWVKPGPGADNDMMELFEHRVTENNRYTNWKVYYDLINRANYVLENVPRVPLDANFFSELERNMFLGEARFLRSWAYFNLAMNFNSVPLVLNAVDNISKVPYLGATEHETILDFIEKDLDTAFQLTNNGIINVPNTFEVGKRPSEETYRVRATKRTVCALQAEVYLWRNKYTEAAAACSTYTTVGGGAPGAGTWFNLFWGASNTNLFNGEMFFVPFDYLGREVNPMMQITSNDPASGGLYMVAPSDTAIKTYNPNYPNSISNNNAVDEINRGFGRSYAGSAPYYNRINSDPVIWKYIGLGVVNPSTANVVPNVRQPYRSDARFHIYRFADVHLLWAEALNRLGDKATAIQRINSVRSAGGTGMPNVNRVNANSSTEEIEDEILRERGMEFGFEGRRWYDLMRMARRRGPQFLIDRVKKRAPESLHTHIETTLSDPKNWYLPYNAEEKRLNPNL